MKKIMFMVAALSLNVVTAQDFDNDIENQEVEAIGAAENAVDVGPSDVATEQDKNDKQDVAQLDNDEAEFNNENETEE
jgi:hypothetical protein